VNQTFPSTALLHRITLPSSHFPKSPFHFLLGKCCVTTPSCILPTNSNPPSCMVPLRIHTEAGFVRMCVQERASHRPSGAIDETGLVSPQPIPLGGASRRRSFSRISHITESPGARRGEDDFLGLRRLLSSLSVSRNDERHVYDVTNLSGFCCVPFPIRLLLSKRRIRFLTSATKISRR
jgi:hypothetical protein